MSTPRSSIDIHHNSTSPSRGKLRKSRPSTEAEQNILSREDAEWFITLPEAVKRKHFTLQEREILEGRCSYIMLDAADETLYRLGHKRNDSSDSLFSQATITAKRRSMLGEMQGFDIAQMVQEESSSSSSSESLGGFGLGLVADDNEEDLTDVSEDEDQGYDDYHKSLQEDQPSKSSRLSFRRSFPDKVFGFGNVEPSTASPGYHSRRHSLVGRRSLSVEKAFSKASPISHAMSFEPTETCYYQDPEARLKLRVYLASPQKFDEVIEFGFPSTQKEEIEEIRPETSTVRPVDPDFEDKSFLFNDEKGIFEEYDIPLSVALQSDPRVFRESQDLERASMAAIKKTTVRTSCSNNSLRPRIVSNHYRHESATKREMTLRMTLTRPDLRSDEELLYGPTRRSTSTSLSSASESSSMSSFDGNWDGLDTIQESKGFSVKKMWKKVKKGGRAF
ncbi:hypothetical protein BJ508DRAFT_418985 [Ascobolus immersus RN42]|uniref:Uncharacterized protein n=1 Tax=Ascobolus immersus RN42 TaxID=1160509 RepID=A0A3N4HKX7_ASCIM|nr:hypothetical protein BJ508DRAFT_418985 [Ascobolus immersus RN42]